MRWKKNRIIKVKIKIDLDQQAYCNKSIRMRSWVTKKPNRTISKTLAIARTLLVKVTICELILNNLIKLTIDLVRVLILIKG
jgi:hypothetical protein